MTATLANISFVEIFLQILKNFGKCSGSKTNILKSEALWIGASKNSLERPLGPEWCTGVKTSGPHFSCDQGQIIKHDFHERLSEIQETINVWSLSSFGKVTVIKTFLVPKLLYVSIILETLEETMKQMERMIFNFL